jgi:predicted  nucleic acid-binding Zn-ribbon protein
MGEQIMIAAMALAAAQDDYIKELRAEIERLRKGLSMARRPYNGLWNEIEQLRETLRWIEDHSNDPGVVLKVSAALGHWAM